MVVVQKQNKNKDIEAIYLLSPMQQGMLFHTLYNPESRIYFEQQGFELDKAPLMRCALIRVADETYQFVWIFHHLFESIVVFENYPVTATLQDFGGNLRIGDRQAIGQTNYPLTVVAIPGDELVVKINYDRDHFDADTIDGCVAKTRGSLVEVVFILTVSRLTHRVHEPLFSL